MDVLNFVDAAVAFLNIGLFSTLISRFTGANMAMLVFCSLLYMGSRFAASRKRLFASSLSHIARYAPSPTYKNTLPIRHKSPHQND